MKIAMFTVAVLALIQTLLGIGVSVCRRKYKVSSGCPEDPDHMLNRFRTAFSNCAEWHPLFMALLLVVQMTGGPQWLIFINSGVVLARCLLVAGLLTFTLKKSNPMRVAGASLNYLMALALIALLLNSFFLSLQQTVN